MQLGVPISGIAAIDTASARQFFFRYGELVGLPRPYDQDAALAAADLAGNHILEMAVPKAVQDDLAKEVQPLAVLGSAGPCPSNMVTLSS